MGKHFQFLNYEKLLPVFVLYDGKENIFVVCKTQQELIHS